MITSYLSSILQDGQVSSDLLFTSLISICLIIALLIGAAFALKQNEAA